MKIFIKDGMNSKEISLEELLAMSKDPMGARAGFTENAMAHILGTGNILDGLRFPNRIKMEAYSPVEVNGESVVMKRFKNISRGEVEGEDTELVKAIQSKVVNEGLPNIMEEHLKWEEDFENLVSTEGLQHILDLLFVGATSQRDPWYVGLINDNSASFDIQPGDTMPSHGTWTEDSTYTGDRKAYVDVRAAQSVSNTASTADFAINGTTTVAGAFLTSLATTTTGLLLCGGAFSGGERSVINGDTLQVTYTFTAADDGA